MVDLPLLAGSKLAEEREIRPPSSDGMFQRIQHECEVHQHELELQNDELRLAQSAAESALECYTDLFEFAPVGYFNLSSDGVIRLVNLVGSKFTGQERTGLIGQRLGLFVVVDDRKKFSDFLAQVFAAGSKQTCELALDREGRAELFVHLEATVTPDGKACRAVMTDITSRWQAEQALIANATFTSDVLDSLTDHVIVLDEKGGIIAVNEPWRRFAWMNDGATDHLGENYLAVCLQGVMRGRVSSAAQTEAGIRAILDGTLAHFIFECPCDSPTEERWFRLHVVPLRGEQHGVVISHHNISESRKAERAALKSFSALQVSKRHFQGLFDQAAVGVALAEVSTRNFVQVNRRFSEITGYSETELVKLSFADLTHPEGVAQDVAQADKLKAGSIREYTREKRYMRKDHSEIWVSLTVSAMWAVGETPDFLIAVIQDITARKLLEEQVRQSQKMEAIGTLAGGIAHDFNNILAAINGYTELSLMLLEENPKVRDHLCAVLKASARATDFVRQILSFSRRQALDRKPVALGPIVAECTTLLRATIPASIEFDVWLAPDAPLVLADATQIHQILMNLGTNAWHAMKDRTGRFDVKLERYLLDEAAAKETQLHPGICARITVSDTGCGMNKATLSRIFDPFFTTKPVGEGTGLGLAVVHGIMDSHGGAITVQSTPGQGSVFRLYFPETTGEPASSATAAESVPHGEGERILVVDDEVQIVQLMQLALTELGYEVEVATQPAAALAKVSADPKRFALVLTDQTMPGMTGMQLASRLRLINPGLPVILTTGYIAALTSEQVNAAGISQLLLKPVSLHSLRTAVQAALETKTSN